MIKYYNNRTIAKKLNINLPRWKRWSRAFLPPDPLGGYQSGYARQYLIKDVFKVFLGGHLVSHLKVPVPEAFKIIEDLEVWLTDKGFYNNHVSKNGFPDSQYRIYIRILPQNTNGNVGICYLVRKTLSNTPSPEDQSRRRCEVYEEVLIYPTHEKKTRFFDTPFVRLLNISALYKHFIELLERRE